MTIYGRVNGSGIFVKAFIRSPMIPVKLVSWVGEENSAQKKFLGISQENVHC